MATETVSPLVTTAPKAITTPMELGTLLAHLCSVAQPNTDEAHAEWFSEGTSTLVDQIGAQASTLCEVLASRDELDKDEHAMTFFLLGNVFSLLSGLANVSQEMAHTHQNRVSERQRLSAVRMVEPVRASA